MTDETMAANVAMGDAPIVLTITLPPGTELTDDERADFQRLFNLVAAMLSCGMSSYDVFSRIMRLDV